MKAALFLAIEVLLTGFVKSVLPALAFSLDMCDHYACLHGAEN